MTSSEDDDDDDDDADDEATMLTIYVCTPQLMQVSLCSKNYRALRLLHFMAHNPYRLPMYVPLLIGVGATSSPNPVTAALLHQEETLRDWPMCGS